MRTLTSHSSWTLFDPRRGPERRYELKAGVVRSNAEYQCWVLETPNVKWESVAHAVDRLIDAGGGDGFVLHVPWRAESLGSRSDLHLTQIREMASGAILAGAEVQELATRVLAVRQRLGGSQSGLWALGSTRSFAALEDQILAAGAAAQSPTFAVAAAMDTLGCALAIDDGADTIFVRLSVETESLIVQLTSAIKDTFGVDINASAGPAR